MAVLHRMPDPEHPYESEFAGVPAQPVSIRPLEQRNLERADRIFRLAFGTFLGLPDPMAFAGDAEFVRSRWRVDPLATLGAEIGGTLVGSNFAIRWGTVGFFGPLTVAPALWDRGIARQLLAPTMEIFAGWRLTHSGLFTFSQSTKHVGLYQKFDFWPRFLTMIMAKPVSPATEMPAAAAEFSGLTRETKTAALQDCREVADSLYAGLDLTREIRAADEQKLGDTILLAEGTRLAGFAVCHSGAGSEAGSGSCYVKFAAVRHGPAAERHFHELLTACEALAARRGAARLLAGVNTARAHAYRSLLAGDFRAEIQGVVMQRGNDPGYNREEVFAIDDWR